MRGCDKVKGGFRSPGPKGDIKHLKKPHIKLSNKWNSREDADPIADIEAMINEKRKTPKSRKEV